jgi:hypothetical protein
MRLSPGSRRAAVAVVAMTCFSFWSEWRADGLTQGLLMALTLVVTGVLVVVLSEMAVRGRYEYPPGPSTGDNDTEPP